MLSTSMKGLIKQFKLQDSEKINNTLSYHMQYGKETLRTTASCLRGKVLLELTSVIVCANRLYYEIGLPSLNTVAKKNLHHT